MPEAQDIELQSKEVNSSTNLQTITPDSGYYALSSVVINPIPTAVQATPSISVSSSGKITASSTQEEGYVSAGTKSATNQLATQAAKTVTPTKSSQTAVASGRYTTDAVTVAAIPDSYIQPTGTLSVTKNGTHDVTEYASVNVNVESGTGQEIPQGTVLEKKGTIILGKAGPIYGGGTVSITISYCDSVSVSNGELVTSEVKTKGYNSVTTGNITGVFNGKYVITTDNIYYIPTYAVVNRYKSGTYFYINTDIAYLVSVET